mmetsp:Transcript_23572/g.44510  ORF Transcript_23572/g.44510 Transcript_23572/m.44510 type:complete len:205 (+) Transcript_23572:71-685(+)
MPRLPRSTASQDSLSIVSRWVRIPWIPHVERSILCHDKHAGKLTGLGIDFLHILPVFASNLLAFRVLKLIVQGQCLAPRARIQFQELAMRTRSKSIGVPRPLLDKTFDLFCLHCQYLSLRFPLRLRLLQMLGSASFFIRSSSLRGLFPLLVSTQLLEESLFCDLRVFFLQGIYFLASMLVAVGVAQHSATIPTPERVHHALDDD